MLRARIALERLRNGEADRSLINLVSQVTLIARFVVQAGHGKLDTEVLEAVKRGLDHVLVEADNTGTWNVPVMDVYRKEFGDSEHTGNPVRHVVHHVLAMATEQIFGDGHADTLVPYTVSLGHPEAMKLLLDSASDINAHFSSAPFVYEELARPRIRKVLDSYEVLGGPHTYNAVWACGDFHDANPTLSAAFVQALQESLERIVTDPAAAATRWIQAENTASVAAAQIEEIVRKPQNQWSMTPNKVMAFANFMKKTGLLSAAPVHAHELFFDNVGPLDTA
ncbi:hypothetical protein B0G80_5005 [Paraburkholderia sp. BL6669N2]|uniref:hypothetical protein n=1 Tax=Paraburkholderia sp. BL6669N2 TaxID=1938807 RepID=UPI000E3A2CAB|nr:hypothetical protein [Paraburkholderia sp. BL6669N2]REG48719.1 hypothetical protein B0G80_5005 [Paraburkholderia sp. BL6669N2]